MARSKPYSSAKLRAVRPALSTAPPSTEISPSALLCIKSQDTLKPNVSSEDPSSAEADFPFEGSPASNLCWLL